MLFVCLIMINFIALADNEQADFGYWRLKSGSYEYSVQQTVFSNAVTRGGWSYSVVFAVTIHNMTNNIRVSFHKLISDSAIGTEPKFKDRLEKQSRQIQEFTGSFKIGTNDNKLELEKSDNLLADDFFGQFKNMLSFPTPRKLIDGMIWTNSATFLPGVNTELLRGHNESNELYVISDASIKNKDTEKVGNTPASSLVKPYIVVDKRTDQVLLLSNTFTQEKMQTNIQTLKFVEGTKSKERAIKRQQN
jgi:hypothetical protein